MDGAFLKRAAVLLFHADPERFVTGAYLKIGFFKNDGELLYHDEVHGSLFAQVDKAMDLLLTKYLKAAIRYEGVQRIETYPVPEEALREALLKAIAHKDYGSGIPIQISVYDDHLSVWNNGPLQEGWTVARLQGKHASQPPNPDIANAFFRAGMIESWGLGIEKMRRACRRQRVPVPKLREEAQGLWVEFGFPVSEKAPVETPVEISAKTPDRILAYLQISPAASLADTSAAIGKSLRAVERASTKLIEEGRLRFVGPRKSGRWKVLK